VVLDEPTSFLDVEAEHEVFTRFRQLAAGRSAILISQRRRLGAKMAVLRQTFYPTRASMARIYRTSPDTAWIYLYYPVRWVDLLARYGRHAWGLWRGDRRVHDELRAVNERAALRDWLLPA
jgi:hypothetical protein